MSIDKAVTDQEETNEVVLDQEETETKVEGLEPDSDNQDESSKADDGEVNKEDSKEDDSEVTVTIGEESPPQDKNDESAAPEWVRELRKTNRELKKKTREQQEKLDALSGAVHKPVELGNKPTLEDADYDSDKFEASLSDWFEKKRLVDERDAQRRAQEKIESDAWASQLKNYSEKKTSLKVRDYEDTEEVVTEKLNQTQLGMIIQGADNPATLVYALGKNTSKLKELSEIKDHVKFAFAVAKLETQLKVIPTRKPPAPETKVEGGSGVRSASDATLNRLRAEAEKTNDYSKLLKYKNELKKK